MSAKITVINGKDNVAVALKDIGFKEEFELPNGSILTVKEDVKKGHKIALKDISKGENIIKYGFPIGHAICDIKEGYHVHVHNVNTNLKGKLEYKYEPNLKKPSEKKEGTFKGYIRENGSVGIRNDIWIINTVFCVNTTAKIIEQKANELFKGKVDGIYSFTHPYGCSQMGEDHATTQKILADLVNHPNAAGVLVLGLGCEDNNIEAFKKVLGSYDDKRVKFVVSQESDNEIDESIELIGELVKNAQRYKRQEVPLSKLVVGLKCGGSDGFSGLTGNPLLGAFSDMLISYGGTTILTEVPEMFGAETILMNRCINKEVFNKTVSLINDFKDYFLKNKQVIYDNPSPGNKDGGLTTLEDKSLGCTQKGGTENVMDVLDYGEVVKTNGLNLLKSPGNDGVSTTALTASGAHIILFTTGRGTPFGTPVPTVKVSTNTDLYNKKKDWIDFNAGQLVDGKPMEVLKKEFFDYVISVASGETETENEKNGFKEIVIFKNGVTV